MDKYLIEKCNEFFSFLQQDYGFSDFKSEWWREEINISCDRDNCKISIFTTIYDKGTISIYITDKTNERKNILDIDRENENLKLLSEIAKVKADDFFIESAKVLKKIMQQIDK